MTNNEYHYANSRLLRIYKALCELRDNNPDMSNELKDQLQDIINIYWDDTYDI